MTIGDRGYLSVPLSKGDGVEQSLSEGGKGESGRPVEVA